MELLETNTHAENHIYCLGCYIVLNSSSLNYDYHINNEALISILKRNVLQLCDICKEEARATENFLRKVKNNLIILEKSTSNETLPSKINDNELLILDEDKEKLVNLDYAVKVKKEEPSSDAEDFDHDYESLSNQANEIIIEIKKEDGRSKNSGLKKSLQTKLRRLKKKNEIYFHNNLSEKVLIISVSRTQCLKDREKMLKGHKFLNSKYKCKNCVKGFSFGSVFEKHLLKHDKASGAHECDICKLRFKTKEKLICHMRYHQRRYKCIECDFVRVCRQTVVDHYLCSHKKQEAGLFPCQFCSKIFNKHLSEVSNAEKPQLKHVCTECGKAFHAPSSLKNHMIKHTSGRNYYCVECDKAFKTDLALKRHWKITSAHAEYSDLPYKCDHCHKRFGINRDLERHMNRVHLNIKPFTCDHCDKAYVNEWSLKDHKRFAHEGQKRPRKFPCNICEKVFDRNSTRKAHIRTHTGERPYVCPDCPAKFKQAGTLGTHMKLVHLKLTRDGRPKQSIKGPISETCSRVSIF
ncbi:gastrula zinc finger protein XlCGF46.1-like isoform X2 [Leptidea sinapis]|uniref:gastrula zinc finger protein XlCGF46.1-like isoform X2 n=1 Tax=Leptidea sinapis TaxID=189913 RepID=UPI00213FCC0C|nr:gastrula zinc finger protein XlCGF46.1-like isoform X2 [Leptidea sinapis]